MDMSVSTIQDITLSDLQLLSWDLKLFCREFTIINNLLSNWGLEKNVSQDFPLEAESVFTFGHIWFLTLYHIYYNIRPSMKGLDKICF